MKLRQLGTILAIVLLLTLPTPSPAATDTVTLTWGASPSEDINGYNLYYGTSPGEYGAPIPVGNVTRHDLLIEDIPDGAETTYYFGVSAVDTSGNESAITATTPAGEPVTRRWDFLAPSPPPSLSAE